MNYIEEAKRVRPLIEKAVQSLSGTDAVQVKSMHPKWSELVKLGRVDTNGQPGYRFRYDGDGELYACVNGDPEFQKNWLPGDGTSALYIRVDESHAGTLENPIPYETNMEIYEGKYYIQNGVTYLCTRSSGQPLYHDLSALVGHYVEVIS